MRKLLMIIGIATASASAGALDNTVHNSFWDTRNYVNPTPSIAQSVSSVTASFDLSGRSWRVAEQLRKEFKSKRFAAFSLTIR